MRLSVDILHAQSRSAGELVKRKMFDEELAGTVIVLVPVLPELRFEARRANRTPHFQTSDRINVGRLFKDDDSTRARIGRNVAADGSVNGRSVALGQFYGDDYSESRIRGFEGESV